MLSKSTLIGFLWQEFLALRLRLARRPLRPDSSLCWIRGNVSGAKSMSSKSDSEALLLFLSFWISQLFVNIFKQTDHSARHKWHWKAWFTVATANWSFILKGIKVKICNHKIIKEILHLLFYWWWNREEWEAWNRRAIGSQCSLTLYHQPRKKHFPNKSEMKIIKYEEDWLTRIRLLNDKIIMKGLWRKYISFPI